MQLLSGFFHFSEETSTEQLSDLSNTTLLVSRKTDICTKSQRATGHADAG